MDNTTQEKIHDVRIEDSSQPGLAGPTDKIQHSEEHVPAELINGVPYWRTKLFLGSFWAIGFGLLACYAGFAMPANTLGLIDADIGPSPNINWVALVWTLTVAVGYTLVGRLSDIFGRRYFFIGGAVLGLIGSIVAATAKNVNALIGATVLLGLAASSQISFTYVTGELVPVRHRFIVNGLINFVNMPVGVFGPVIARSLILHTSAGWRWNYYICIILNTLSLILWTLFYFPPDFAHLHKVRSRWQEIKSIDYVGVCLFTGGLLLFLMGLSWGGSQYPWRSAHVIACIVVGFATIVAFILYETYSGVYRPLVPMHIFRDFQYDAIVILTTVGGMIYYSMTVIYPTALTVLYTTDTMKVGWLSCAVGGGTLSGQVIGGLIAMRIGHIKYQMIFAATIMSVFIGALAAQTKETVHLSSAFATLGCFGLGYVEILAATAATFVIKNQKQMGTPNGIFGSIRSAGGVLATTIYLTILSNTMTKNTTTIVIPALVKAGLPKTSLAAFLVALNSGVASAIEAVPGVNAKIILAGSEALVAAYTDAFQKVFLASIAFGTCSVAAACVLKPFTKEELSGAIVFHLGKEAVHNRGDGAVEAHAAESEEAPLD
ncbi:fungal trichothecene efflux pump [Exophiala viscosa]|uniref:Fungal trichothecene efflux pump n=1 Tax=Exophiala viscosa TaxID=2486360 RepID=A0AAN6IHY2_9EURO|nr:fungal trichothecene efflux pump [Exophiala viscosa]KAI1630498.1 fungal trichothecene efflux pump [Exophiala viscosa]